MLLILSPGTQYFICWIREYYGCLSKNATSIQIEKRTDFSFPIKEAPEKLLFLHIVPHENNCGRVPDPGLFTVGHFQLQTNFARLSHDIMVCMYASWYHGIYKKDPHKGT